MDTDDDDEDDDDGDDEDDDDIAHKIIVSTRFFLSHAWIESFTQQIGTSDHCWCSLVAC